MVVTHLAAAVWLVFKVKSICLIGYLIVLETQKNTLRFQSVFGITDLSPGSLVKWLRTFFYSQPVSTANLLTH